MKAIGGRTIGDYFIGRELQFAGFEEAGHRTSVASRDPLASRVPRTRSLAELIPTFWAAFRVVGCGPAGHHGAVLTSKAPFFFQHFDLSPHGSRAMMVLTLCRELAPLAVRCERRRQARRYRSDPSGIDDTYAPTCDWQAAKRGCYSEEHDVNPYRFVRAVHGVAGE